MDAEGSKSGSIEEFGAEGCNCPAHQHLFTWALDHQRGITMPYRDSGIGVWQFGQGC